MHKAVAVIFLLFAIVQYNDPDFAVWVPAYLAVSIMVMLFDQGKTDRRVWIVAVTLYGAWMISYGPEVVKWAQKGMPSITGSMQAESPFIEFVREFFGLALCLITSIVYLRKST